MESFGDWTICRQVQLALTLLALTPVASWGTAPSVSFVDFTAAAHFDYSHGYSDCGLDNYCLVAGGVAAGDYDGDGWVDLYAIGGDAGSNHLFHNRKDGTFEDLAVGAGVALSQTRGSGPVFGDYNGDGHLDLFVGAIEARGPSLFRNRGDGTFENVTKASNFIFELGPYIGATFGDYDLDGDLDLFITQWGTVVEDFNMPDHIRQLEHLWRNNGDETFSPGSSDAGIVVKQSILANLHWYWTFTANFADINNDGWPDLLLTSDFKNSQVFMATGEGHFVETTNSVISDENGMGAAVGDYDNDGDLDWFVSSIYDPENPVSGTMEWGGNGNRLYRNKGDGSFEDVTDAAGVRNGAWGWGSCFADFNNDGFLDLFHVNGWGIQIARSKFFAKPSRLFMSNGDGTFTEEAEQAGVGALDEGRGVVCFDYDRDGDIDIFVANSKQPPRLFRNDTGNQNHFLQVRLRGKGANTQGIGARVYATVGGITQMRELRAGSNYVSQDPPEAHFGLASATEVDDVYVVWPDRTVQHLGAVAADQFLIIDASVSATPFPTEPFPATPSPTPFEPTPTSSPSEPPTFEPGTTETPTVTASPTVPIATPSESPTKIPAAIGDANCDGERSAADLTETVRQLVSPRDLLCQGLDSVVDGTIDDRDLACTRALLFEASH